jgi:hypothetical protein
MLSRSIRKAVRPYLHPTEELLAAVLAQNAGANAAATVYALRGETATVRAFAAADRAHAEARSAAEPAGMRVDRRMVIAITSRRLLVFRSAGAFTVKAKELLAEAPIADVDGIDVAPDGLAKAVTLHVRGAAIRVETARGQRAQDLPRALQHARDGDLRRAVA